MLRSLNCKHNDMTHSELLITVMVAKIVFVGVRMCSVFYIPGWDILGAKLYMRRVFFLHALILSYVRDKIGRA